MSGITDLLSNTWGLVLVVIFFSGAIFFHELGHFLAAKWRGLKIERFSIGFGPRLFGWTGKDGVDYRVSLLPLGGYVALPQLGEMQLLEGKSSSTLPPIRYSDKLIVAVAGPVFNVLLALFLAAIIWIVGYPTPMVMESHTIGYVEPKVTLDSTTRVISPAAKAGLQPGDEILEIDGKSVANWMNVAQYVVTGTGRDALGNPEVTLKLRRGDEVLFVNLSPDLKEINARSGKYIRVLGIHPSSTLSIAAISPNSPAQRFGLKPGDLLQKANGQPLYSIPQLNEIIENRGAAEVKLGILRDGTSMEVAVVPEVVPATKPLVRLQTIEGEAAWTFLPQYLSENADPTSLNARAELLVFDAPLPVLNSPLLPVGSQLVAVNGQKVDSLQGLEAVLESSGGEAIQVQWEERGSEADTLLEGPFQVSTIPPETRTLIGFTIQQETVITHPNPITQLHDQIKMTFLFIGSLLSPRSDVGINQLSGPIGIGRVIHTFSLEDLRLAIWFSVLLNINLAILNLMPIPVLDGGHIVIATLTRLLGRALPLRLLGAIQGAMLLALFGLMFYVLFNDSMDWLGDREEKQRYLRESAYYIPLKFNPDNLSP